MALGDEQEQGAFTPDQLQRIDSVIASHAGKPGALIPVLEQVQEIAGYLPESLQRRVARGLDLPLSRVYGVVTFYSFFTMQPRGKHQVRVCLGTACHVRGGKRCLEHIEQQLHIKPGECTEDRQFSLEVVRCLGACGLAPVMVIDENIHKQVKEARLNRILKQYQQHPEQTEG